MLAKRKCKEDIAIQTHLNRPNENAEDDQIFRSVVHHEDTSEVKSHISGIEYHIYPHIVNYNYNFCAKKLVVITFFVISRSHFNTFEKNQLAAIKRSPAS
jgi:hypothetical protein